jgi:hypothetical protein
MTASSSSTNTKPPEVTASPAPISPPTHRDKEADNSTNNGNAANATLEMNAINNDNNTAGNTTDENANASNNDNTNSNNNDNENIESNNIVTDNNNNNNENIESNNIVTDNNNNNENIESNNIVTDSNNNDNENIESNNIVTDNNNNNNVADLLTVENLIAVILHYLRLHSQMPESSSVRQRNSRNVKTNPLALIPGGQETVIVLKRGNPRLAIYENIHYGENYRTKLVEDWRDHRTNRRTNTQVLAAITFMDAGGPEVGRVFYQSERPEHEEELRHLIGSILTTDNFNFDEVQNALDEAVDR